MITMAIQNDIFNEINDAEKNNSPKKCISLCRKALSLPGLVEKEELFKIKIKLAYLLIEEGDKDYNEEALEILNRLLTTLPKSEMPEKSAFLNLALGYAYYRRKKGNKKKNIRKSIFYYEQALHFFTINEWPQEWAMTKAGIGKAYSEISGNESDSIRAIENYLNTLSVYTRDKYPEDYKDSIKEISLLKQEITKKAWDDIMEKWENE